MTTVALVQLPGQVPAERGQAFDLAAEQILAAAASAPDLIVLPEVWYPGYFAFDNYETAAEHTPALLEAFSDLAKQAKSCLHVGSLIERITPQTAGTNTSTVANTGASTAAGIGSETSTAIYNTSVLFGPDGAELGRYRKIHLFGYGSREQQLLTAGDEVVVADTPLGRLGMAVCYDLRFPEHFRRMSELGAIGFVVASAWPHPRVEAWSTLLRARAIENQAFMFACNGVGPAGPPIPAKPANTPESANSAAETDPTPTAVLCGRSAVIDPWGTTVASLADDPATAIAHVDMNEAAASRAKFPALADRQLTAEPDNDLLLRTSDESVIRFSAKRLILAGYTGRDTEAVNAYIAKLETEGIAPPSEVPSYFVLGADRLTTANSIEVATPSSCGEVEFALLIDTNDIWVAVASDHTDRELETVDIPASKQTCAKVLSEQVWHLSEVQDHWDELIFVAHNPADASTDASADAPVDAIAPYQYGSVAALRSPAELIELVQKRFGEPMVGTVILSGTIAAAGEFEYHPSFAVQLQDPVRSRTLTASYTIKNVLETS